MRSPRSNGCSSGTTPPSTQVARAEKDHLVVDLWIGRGQHVHELRDQIHHGPAFGEGSARTRCQSVIATS